jgi:hypothetical protein
LAEGVTSPDVMVPVGFRFDEHGQRDQD